MHVVGWQTSVRKEQHLKQPFLDRQIQGLGGNFLGDRFVLMGRRQAVSWASPCKPWPERVGAEDSQGNGFQRKGKRWQWAGEPVQGRTEGCAGVVTSPKPLNPTPASRSTPSLRGSPKQERHFPRLSISGIVMKKSRRFSRGFLGSADGTKNLSWLSQKKISALEVDGWEVLMKDF